MIRAQVSSCRASTLLLLESVQAPACQVTLIPAWAGIPLLRPDFHFLLCISNPNFSCKVTDQRAPPKSEGRGPVCGGVPSAAGRAQTLYKGAFLHPAAHWRNTSWRRGLLRMHTLVLLLLLAGASPSVASKWTTVALSSGLLSRKSPVSHPKLPFFLFQRQSMGFLWYLFNFWLVESAEIRSSFSWESHDHDLVETFSVYTETQS